MEKSEELRYAELPSRREVILACKFSWRALRCGARAETSGNCRVPFLIWDVLTLPDRSYILRLLTGNCEKPGNN